MLFWIKDSITQASLPVTIFFGWKPELLYPSKILTLNPEEDKCYNNKQK
jgi:hypothetical protein